MEIALVITCLFVAGLLADRVRLHKALNEDANQLVVLRTRADRQFDEITFLGDRLHDLEEKSKKFALSRKSRKQREAEELAATELAAE